MLLRFFSLVTTLPILIVVHELGHYWCARWLSIQLTDFSIGLGPLLWQRKRAGVRFAIYLWPIAAHVRPAVAKGDAPELDASRLIQNRPIWQQLSFLAGGAAANFALAYLLLLGKCVATGDEAGAAISQLGSMTATLGSSLLNFLGFTAGAKLGAQPQDYIQQVAFLSLGFGVCNLLPLPPFDGSRILILLLRKFFGDQ